MNNELKKLLFKQLPDGNCKDFKLEKNICVYLHINPEAQEIFYDLCVKIKKFLRGKVDIFLKNFYGIKVDGILFRVFVKNKEKSGWILLSGVLKIEWILRLWEIVVNLPKLEIRYILYLNKKP
jgi:hypothetical protein